MWHFNEARIITQSFRWLREAGGWEDSEVSEEPPSLPEHQPQDPGYSESGDLSCGQRVTFSHGPPAPITESRASGKKQKE